MTSFGFQVVAEALARQNLQFAFGIVGIPVTEIAALLQANNVKYYGFRNEQAAAYAASIIGYLTQRPGIVLAVSGPGVTNTISGMANAMVNKWPMICIGGAPDALFEGKGGFQEYDTMTCCKPVTKYAARATSIKHIPIIVERAVRLSMYGTPGPVYLEFTADVLHGQIDSSEINYLPSVEPLSKYLSISQYLCPTLVTKTLALLMTAKKPLVIVGKGVGYGDAYEEMRSFLTKSNLPFLATPMGKGIVEDDSHLSVASARTYVLQNADVVFLCGARLNWILHFGAPPRFNKDVKIIQLDNDPHEISTNLKAEIALLGEAKNILGQLAEAVKEPIQAKDSAWWKGINDKKKSNKIVSDKLAQDLSLPMNYYSTLTIIENSLLKSFPKKDYFLVSEGSNTMDIGRTILSNAHPKLRLDAATFGTMGVGFGFAIAAQALKPDKKVIMVVGDSAFGFSGMEIETAARYKLPLKVIIINNNGITQGNEDIDQTGDPLNIPANQLTPYAKYEMIAQAFGGKGISVKDHASLEKVLPEILNDNNLWILNVYISPSASRKAQEFSWLTREEAPKPKL